MAGGAASRAHVWGGLGLERMLGAKGSARLEQGGGPIPVLFLDVGAAEQPRGFGVRSLGKEVREELPGLRGPAGPEQRTGQEQPERSHRSGSGGLSLGIELKPPVERSRRRRRDRSSSARAVPSTSRPRASHPGCRTSRSAGFLGRVFPVILKVKLGQRVERLRMIGVGEPGPFIGLEGEHQSFRSDSSARPSR